MHIHKIEIKNFRLLKEVDLSLEKRTTVIVGRNNSGKTSITELFRRLLKENLPTFQLEDFSLSVHEDFWKAFLLKHQGREENEIRKALPIIEVKLIVDYEKNASSLGPLGDFIIDLNPDCTETFIVIRYQLKNGEIDAFFKDFSYDPKADDSPQRTTFFRAIKERVKKCYTSDVLAMDPNDSTNQKNMEWSQLRALLQSGFINAQRGIDDTTHKDINLLGKILESLFKTAMSDSADPKDRDIAQKIGEAVKDIQGDIDDSFNKQLVGLLPAFSLFGYPGLSDPRLLTETTLDVERLLKDHTKVYYTGVNGINLPESYNGLGVRNLIFILLKLLDFFKSFIAKEAEAGIHLIFIEEPEVHMHPQMQEVFIGKLSAIADVFAHTFNKGLPWPVQFVVTTHSSHLANKATFESMRYFLATSDEHAGNVRSTQIKGLREDLGGTPPEDQKFLHKYMTLTRCDLLFADKAILIEGTTERLLLPKMIEKVDAETPNGPHLSSQYVSVVEVGGAYAHKFLNLFNFLELRTLIITDLDSVKKNENNRFVSCEVSEGSRTSNACIKDWFQDKKITPDDIINKSTEEKTKGIIRLAYQVPEANGNPCGRSLEEAFILANPDLFELTDDSAERDEEEVSTEAKDMKKSEFALKYAIEKTEWAVPRYIKEGLIWLAENPKHPATSLSDTSDNAPKEAEITSA
ncbi:ATP-dependent endonuclease [Patescibacteria group bacterium]|nr:ATP-dependent endonuclease [Patescibacteria group bacterium]MBU1956744.1 ATP-dependent endonuclease [Patescibacteria group bacterium]